MQQKDFWLRIFNVRPDESWLVKRVFFLQFLQGAGLAFFFTASFAFFLSRFPITELPYVFIYSSLLLWVAGFFYSKLEHRYAAGKLAMVVTLFIAASILAFRLAFAFVQTDWFLYWMLAWFNVLYLLNNLEFWGLAALLFNARQSKRLFAVVSAGDIPAKFIGYTLALFVVEFIGTINLLWAALACVLGSMPLLIKIRSSGHLKEHKHKQEHTGAILHNIPVNILTRRLAFLTIIVSSCFIIINFAFYAGVKTTYENEIGLAKFIAFFLAFVRVIALIIKMIFTSRLINKLGIINSLLVTPLLMIFMVAIVLLEQNINGGQKLILYLFGITALSVDILRSSINSPVFLTIMQPLSIHERLRAHTIVKGLMDPFASLLTGILLLILINYQQRVDLMSLCYILLGGGILWIVSIFKVNRQYRKTILQSITSRYFNLSHFQVSDTDTTEWLKSRLKNSAEQEAINILGLIRNKNDAGTEQLITLALDHPSEKVISTALNIARDNSICIPSGKILSLLEKDVHPAVIADCIELLCNNEKSTRLITRFIDHDNFHIRNAAMKAVLLYGEIDEKKKIERYIIEMLGSGIAGEKQKGANLLHNMRIEDHKELIIGLMDDPHSEVRKSACVAAAMSGDSFFINEMIKRLPRDEKNILHALLLSGEKSIKDVAI